MKKKYKILIVFLCIISFIAFALYGGLIDGGNYGYAEQYDFNTSDSTLIKAMVRFKNENPEYQVPATISLHDYSDNYGDHFFIYYSDRNELIHCFIMSKTDQSNKASFYFDGMSDGSNLGNRKLINKDFDRSENLKAKREFQQRVLDKLKLPYVDQGNNAFIFWK